MRQKKTILEAIDAATDGLIDLAILATEDEALRAEALRAFERFTEIAKKLKDPRPERFVRYEQAEATKLNGEAYDADERLNRSAAAAGGEGDPEELWQNRLLRFSDTNRQLVDRIEEVVRLMFAREGWERQLKGEPGWRIGKDFLTCEEALKWAGDARLAQLAAMVRRAA